MIVVIPLGGLGIRFKEAGYTMPKPLIKVMGYSIIEWLINSLNLTGINRIVIPYHSQLEQYRLEDLLTKRYPHLLFHFVKLIVPTVGATQSVYLALQSLAIDDCPVLCLDGDNFYTCDIIQKWAGKSSVFYFKDTHKTAPYSYLEISNNQVMKIAEKVRISDNASSGAYGFRSYRQLMHYCEQLLATKATTERYLSHVIQLMIKNDQYFSAVPIDTLEHFCLGTPLDVRLFCDNKQQINRLIDNHYLKPQRYCFDLDNTLVTFPKITNDYTTVEPIQSAIDFVKLLKSYGHTIIIYTSRHMQTSNHDVGKAVATIGKITLDTLQNFDIPYDSLHFGKPQADCYIDDLAISSFSNLQKETGYYHSMIEPRMFNHLSDGIIDTYTKRGSHINGEIYWYTHMPAVLTDLFPTYYGCTNDSYTIERLNAIPLSRLYLSEDLTIDHLEQIINAFERIHHTQIPVNECPDISIYDNYLLKLKTRYQTFDYSFLPNAAIIYEQLMSKLQNYQQLNGGKLTIIHGDPVMTNILINRDNSIKLIDMRGLINDVPTLLGDLFYDWAKLYQSLVGYDEILFNQKVKTAYKINLLTFFKNKFVSIFGLDQYHHLQYLTASLFFTLIPLHQTTKAVHYLTMAHKLMQFENLAY